MNKKSNLKGSLLLLLTAVIWGFAFVAQSVGMEYIGPFAYQGIRTLLGALILVPVLFFKSKKGISVFSKENITAGLVCAIVFFSAGSLQQIGIQFTTVGKAGFITAMYMVLVPIFSFIFLKKRTGLLVILSVALAVVGLYFMCINENISISTGDLCVFGCAVMFAVHILVLDFYGEKVDPVVLSFFQYIFSAALSLICMLLFEEISMARVIDAALPLLYGGVMSVGVAYTLQAIGQKYMTNSTLASLIMSLESVFSLIGGMLLLNQIPSTREIIGIVLMSVAVVLAQIPVKAKAKE